MVSSCYFQLLKKNGELAKGPLKKNNEYEMINIKIDGKHKAAILPNYALFYTPLNDYGKKVIEHYHQ